MKLVTLAVMSVAAAAAACTHTRTPDTFVRMEQTECLDRCPVYTVTLYQDGAVEYHGEQYAPLGPQWRKAAPAEIARLMDATDRIPAWTCDPDRIETDHPQSIVTVSRRGQSRRIVHDHGDPCAPDAMEELESDINVAAGTSKIAHGRHP